MALLDSFLLLIQGDASSAIKALTETQYHVNKTADDSEKLEKRNNRLGRSFLTLAGHIAESLTIYHAFEEAKRFFVESVHEAMEIKDFSDALGVNINDVSAWKDAVKIASGDSDKFQQSISTLSKGLSQLDVTGKSRLKPFLDNLGIATEKGGKLRSVFEILPDLADKLSKKTKQESFGIGAKLGLDQGTILLLQKGRAEVDKLVEAQRKNGAITERQGELAEDLEGRMASLGITVRGLILNGFEYGMPFIANFTATFEQLSEVFKNNKEYARGFEIALAGIVAFTEPMLLIGAALLIAADDWLAFNNNQKSAIGYMIDKYPAAASALKAFNGVLKITSLLLENIGGIFSNLAHGNIRNLFNVRDDYGNISDNTGADENKMDYQKQAAFRGQGLLSTASNTFLNSPQLPLAYRSSISDSSANITIQGITITTQATDAAGIAAELPKALQDHLSSTISHFDDGIQK